MTVSYEIDAQRALVRTTLTGRVSDDDLAAHQRRLAADPAFNAELDQLVDALGVTDLAVTGEGVHQLARANLFGPGSRRAIVALSDALYGMARMFQLLRDASPEQIAVFRSRREASAWLGLEDETEA